MVSNTYSTSSVKVYLYKKTKASHGLGETRPELRVRIPAFSILEARNSITECLHTVVVYRDKHQRSTCRWAVRTTCSGQDTITISVGVGKNSLIPCQLCKQGKAKRKTHRSIQANAEKLCTTRVGIRGTGSSRAGCAVEGYVRVLEEVGQVLLRNCAGRAKVGPSKRLINRNRKGMSNKRLRDNDCPGARDKVDSNTREVRQRRGRSDTEATYVEGYRSALVPIAESCP